MEYPENAAVKTWSHDGIGFSVVRVAGVYGHLCGYCRLETRPVKEQGHYGILNYVPVHGGITFAKESEDGSMVYGFDCGHSGDDRDSKTQDMEWVGEEAARMARAILIAAKYEDDYLANDDSAARAAVIDSYHAELARQNINFNLQDNFGAMINVLFGRL